MKAFVTRLSSTKSLCLTFGMFLLLCCLCNTFFQCEFTYLTQTFGYSSTHAFSLLESIGSSGRQSHLLILIADFAMIILYSAFLVGLQYRISSKITQNCHTITLLTFLPLLLSFIQFIEILLTAILILDYGHKHINLAHSTSLLTSIKCVMTPVIFLLPCICFGAKILLSNKKRIHRA